MQGIWERVEEKPFIGTPHNLRGKYFNGGVYAISDPKFVDFNEIAKCFDGDIPPVLDPFGGGGAIPLEAQRLGLTALSGDLNPVAVLINKALI